MDDPNVMVPAPGLYRVIGENLRAFKTSHLGDFSVAGVILTGDHIVVHHVEAASQDRWCLRIERPPRYSAVPVTGYLILWSEEIAPYLQPVLELPLFADLRDPPTLP